MNEIIELLHTGKYSCVIKSGNEIHTYTQRGVADLYDLYQANPVWMKGAFIADKVIGKGAATLIILSEMKGVYTDVISTPALALLRKSNIPVEYMQEVPFIINRDKTGPCPLESACSNLYEPEDIYPVIQRFITRIRNGSLYSLNPFSGIK